MHNFFYTVLSVIFLLSRTLSIASTTRLCVGRVASHTYFLLKSGFFPEHDLLLHELRSNDTDEAGVGPVGYSPGTQRLTRTRGTVQQHTLRGLYHKQKSFQKGAPN